MTHGVRARLRVQRHIGTVLVVAVATGGCFGGDSADPVAVPSAPPGVTAGGELTVGIVAPLSIDPALVTTTDVGGTIVVRTMCDSLLSHDPDSAVLRPAIAQSWRVLDGGERISLRLRDDVRFSNGDRLSAQDVAASLARVVSPDTVSPVAEVLKHVAGYTELRDRKVERDALGGIQIVSSRDVELVLTRRDAEYVSILATTVGVPVPRTSAEDAGFAERPICVGPYQLADAWQPGDPTITLERSDTYVAGNSAMTRNGLGWADQITFRTYATRQLAEQAYRRGEVDVAPVANDRLAQVATLPSTAVETEPTGALEYLGLPTTTAPFDNPEVRRALSQALDRERIVRVVYAGGRVPATSLLPPTLPDGLVDEDVCPGTAPAGGDLDVARASLRASGVDLAGVTVPLYFNDEFRNRALVTEVAAQWLAAFDLRSRLVALPFDAYLARGIGGTGFDGPFRLAHATPYLGAGDFLGPLFSTEAIGTENLSRFSNPRFDRDLRREARQAIAVEDQRDEYAALTRLLCTQLPVIPVAFGTASYLLRSDVLASAAGRVLDRATATPLLREIYFR